MFSRDFEAIDSTKVKSAKSVQSSKQILSAQELNVLNAKSDLKGSVQLFGHLAVMSISGYLWGTNMGNLSDRWFMPTNLKEYIIEISGITWWIGKFKRHFLTAIGNLENCPFIPEGSRAEVIRSNRLQLLVYAVAIAISVYFQQPWFITYWMLPLAVGQPLLRFLLLAEHTDRPNTDNMLANTRTTLTLAPLRFLIWNISYHAEHHLYASIPFHQLGAAHTKLSSHFECVENGYFNVHRQIIANFSKTGNSAA